VKIFKQLVHYENNKAPNIVVALRGNPTLYSEVLGAFDSVNTFELSPANESIRIEIPTHVIQRVQHVKIE